jgi:GTP-binding protein
VGENRGDLGQHFVVADIPGLVPGASKGVGLGSRFLRHVERTRVLLHLITLDYSADREPLADYDALRVELAAFNPKLAEHPEIVALSKSDLPEVREAYPELKKRFAKRGINLWLLSSATHDGLDNVVKKLAEILAQPQRPSSEQLKSDRPKSGTFKKPPAKRHSTPTQPKEPAAKRQAAKQQAVKKPAVKKPAVKKRRASKPSARKSAAKTKRATRRR